MVADQDVILTFAARDYADEAHANDVVSISDDAVTWHAIYDLGSALTSTYAEHEVHLRDAIIDHGVDPGSLLVRFSQYDTYPIGSDGVAIDNVRAEAREALLALFEDDFSHGPYQWALSSTHDGRIATVSDAGASGGAKVVLDDAVAGGAYSHNTMTTTVLSTSSELYDQLELHFTAADLRDEPHALDVVSIADGDGVWHDVFDLGDLNATPTHYVVDLEPTIRAEGLRRTDLQVRFSQYDNFPAPTDGIEIHDVTLYGAPMTTPATGVLVAVNNDIEHYDLSGAWVATTAVDSPPSGADVVRSITVDLGHLQIAYNGTLEPYLSASDDGATWDHYTFDGMSTVDDDSSGAVDAAYPLVFAADMATAGLGAPQGLLRFDQEGASTVRFAESSSYQDVVYHTLLGDTPDHVDAVYGLTDGTSAEVHVFDPASLSSVEEISLPDDDARALEVDVDGTYSWPS